MSLTDLAEIRAALEEALRTSPPYETTSKDQVRKALAALSRIEQAGGWRPIATAPKDGTRILVLCEFANGREPTVVRWVDSPAPAGPFGRFAWREMQDSAIAESVPKFWMPIPDAPEAIP